MSVLLLSLLLLFLIAIGILMGRSLTERFEDAPAPESPKISPALANLLGTPSLVAATSGPTPQVDKLARDRDVAKAAEAVTHPPPPPPPPGPKPAPTPDCPKCPVCPDMSEYVRLDEVPCWNCTLP